MLLLLFYTYHIELPLELNELTYVKHVRQSQARSQRPVSVSYVALIITAPTPQMRTLAPLRRLTSATPLLSSELRQHTSPSQAD